MRSFMFDILQGDMTRSKVILTFTCLKIYIARSGDTSGLKTRGPYGDRVVRLTD